MKCTYPRRGRRRSGCAAVFCVAALSWTSPCAGQTPPLRLGAVYDALSAHPMVDAARAGVRASEARIRPAGRWPDPELQLGLMGRQLPGLGLQDPLGMTTLQVMQMVPIAGQARQAARVEEARAGASRERVADVVWELRNRAAMVFYDLYQSEQAIAVARDSKSLLESIAQTTESMYAIGQGRQSDVLKAQIELARMTEEVTRMEAMEQSARGKLNALLGRPLDSAVPPVAVPMLPAVLPSLDSLESLALAGRPALRAGQRNVEAADAGARLARLESWPDLQVGLQYGQRPMAGGGTDRMISLMLGASIPVNPGRRQQQMRVEADAMRDMAAADLAALRADTRGRLGELYARLESARRLLTLYRQTIIPQADAGAASALVSYRDGAIDLMTLLDAQMGTNRYRLAVVQLEVEAGTAIAELEMLTATPLLDPNSSAPSTGRPQ